MVAVEPEAAFVALADASAGVIASGVFVHSRTDNGEFDAVSVR
jgi:hypothetical protein